MILCSKQLTIEKDTSIKISLLNYLSKKQLFIILSTRLVKLKLTVKPVISNTAIMSQNALIYLKISQYNLKTLKHIIECFKSYETLKSNWEWDLFLRLTQKDS